MTVKAVFLGSAEADLKDLRRYVVKNFGQGAWQSTYANIKHAVKLRTSISFAILAATLLHC